MELNISEVEPPKSILKKNPINKTNNGRRVSYDDILAKMGMYVDNGTLHLGSKDSSTCVKMECSKVKCNKLQQQVANQTKSIAINPHLQEQNSYIYNKYFKNQIAPAPQALTPQTPEEYNAMLKKLILEKKLQKLRLSRIKSTKLIMPDDNIHFAPNPAPLNQLFHFSQR